MSTNSRIGVVNKNGTITSIYCHWDGYPEGVGATLKEHYTDIEKINKLLELGDISSLKKDIGNKQNFNNPTPNTVIAYARDRNYTSTEAISSKNVESFLKLCIKGGLIEYAYLFQDES